MLADQQTAGRGQRGRGFVSQRGRGYISRSSCGRRRPAGELLWLTAWTGVAVCGCGGRRRSAASVRASNGPMTSSGMGGSCAASSRALGMEGRASSPSMVIGVGVNVSQTAEDFGAGGGASGRVAGRDPGTSTPPGGSWQRRCSGRWTPCRRVPRSRGALFGRSTGDAVADLGEEVRIPPGQESWSRCGGRDRGISSWWYPPDVDGGEIVNTRAKSDRGMLGYSRGRSRQAGCSGLPALSYRGAGARGGGCDPIPSGGV